MQSHPLACVAFVLAFAACQDPADSEVPSALEAAQVEPLPAEAPPPSAGLLSALALTPNAQGQIANECGELVTPRILAAELGGAAGSARLVAIEGGPNFAACYGDGPDLHLMLRDGAGYREIYAARGRMLIVLTTTRDGVRDIADGGPGFSFPVWEWNGSIYVSAGRTVADSALGGAIFLP